MVGLLVPVNKKMWTDGGAGAKICRALMKYVHKRILSDVVMCLTPTEERQIGRGYFLLFLP